MRSTPSPAPDIPALVQEVVAAALDHKATDLKVLHLEPVTDFTDYFLIASGSNPRQVQAIADAVEQKLVAARVRPLHVEGQAEAKWVLMDYGDFVVHVFDDDRRGFYALERLWSDAPDVTGDFLGSARVAGEKSVGQSIQRAR